MMKIVKNLKYSKGTVMILFVSQVVAINATAHQTSDEIQDLKRQIQALTQKVDQLEQQQNVIATKQTNAPFITAGAEGFSLQSADQNFILKLSGFAQVDGRDYATPAIGGKDTFTIRRMRAIASGSVYHDFEYYMQTDFGALDTATTTRMLM
jgi:outer membrane murein-binding lipoprotein Lpp